MVPNSARGDADAAEDEVFPRRLERLGGAIEADHHHRGQGGEFDRDPHQANVVGKQRQVHTEQHELEHCVVETDVPVVSRPVSSS